MMEGGHKYGRHNYRPAGALALGHAKLENTALYTRVATKTISEVVSPLEHIALKFKTATPPT